MLCLGLSSQRKKEMPRTLSPHRTNFLMVAKLSEGSKFLCRERLVSLDFEGRGGQSFRETS